MEFHILKFTADWCGPCRAIADDSKKFEVKYNLPVVIVDIDTDPLESERHSVKKIPTLIVMNGDKKEVERFTGANTEMIKSLFAKYGDKSSKPSMDIPFQSDASFKE